MVTADDEAFTVIGYVPAGSVDAVDTVNIVVYGGFIVGGSNAQDIP